MGAELTRRARALTHAGAPGLALPAHAELSARTRALPSASAARNTDVLTVADLTGRTAALAGAARATYPDLTLTIDADLTSRTRTLGSLGAGAACYTNTVGSTDLALRAVALRVIRRAAADARTGARGGVTGRGTVGAAHAATHNARGWTVDRNAPLVLVTGLVLVTAHRAAEDAAHRAGDFTRARLRVTGLAGGTADVPALDARRRATLATLTIDADLAGNTAGIAADEVRRWTVLTDAIEADLVGAAGRGADASRAALAEGTVRVEATALTLLALAVDTDLVARAILASPAFGPGAGLATATPCASAALVTALRAVLGLRVFIPAQTECTEDGGEADTERTPGERLLRMVFGHRNGDGIKAIRIHVAPSLCAIAQRQS